MRLFASLLLLSAITLCLAFKIAPSVTGRGLIGVRADPPSGWSIVDRADANERITFTILLKQRNLKTLEEIFTAVSDPENEKWGQFLTITELDNLIRPERGVFEAFHKWLKPYKHSTHVEERADLIKVTTTVKIAEELLEVPFHVYQNAKGKTLIRYTGKATLPLHLHQHVDFVAGISEFFTSKIEFEIDVGLRSTSGKRKPTVGDDPLINPSVLKSFYNVPANLKGTNPSNLQGIAAFTDYFSTGALAQFEQNFGLDAANVTRTGPDCLPNCDQYESDLDIQYLTAMAQDVPTTFLAQGADYWILQFTEDALKPPIPHVYSLSYGWSELLQCSIATIACSKLGYSSQQYVDRTNTNFQKLGAVGVSVLVSDGDDGAASLGGASGNCPIDPNTYCPTGGCAHTTTGCPSFTIINTTTGEQCFFPMGVGSTACGDALADPNINQAINDFFTGQDASCNVNLEQDAEGQYHFYTTCPCSSIKTVVSNNYNLTQYIFDPANGPVFTADYPTSSPWVTSVGATQFVVNGGQTTEVVCSILNKATITTGGGFSAFQAQPSYQTAAVSNYFQTAGSILPPAFSYDSTKRGYPDVAFNGHNYQIFYSKSTTDNCDPCLPTQVDGTSASSPAFAGLITLINDQLLNNGKTPLGFLNPLLYKMQSESPQTFNDITTGDNKCNRAYCCQYGWTASTGWDPVTGLGSPNFGAMLKYILAKKGIQS